MIILVNGKKAFDNIQYSLIADKDSQQTRIDLANQNRSLLANQNTQSNKEHLQCTHS